MTKSETAPLRAGGRWALGLWIYRSRLIVYPGYTYILRIVTRHMVMHPGMYNHTRVCIITHTTTTISRRHQCDMIVTIPTSTCVITLVASSSRKQRGRIRLDLDLDAPPARETRRTFVTGVRVREAVRGSRASAIPVDRAREKETRTKPTVDGTDARTSNARSHR